MSVRREVQVELGARSYPVVIDTGEYGGLGAMLRARFEGARVMLVTEDTVGPLWATAVEAALGGSGFDVVRIVLPAGEANKTVETWQRCVDALIEAGVDRYTPVLGLGGGVLGDIAGFAAASALRGVPLVQLPTTVLAMVDSSVGGKTGVNHPAGKNLVGAFYQPRLVYAALGTLATLPEGERVAGLAEAVKTAVVGDADLLVRIEEDADALRAGEVAALAPIIARCVALKAEVVRVDEREGGWRAVLNAGHTVAHAVERVAGFGTVRHGEAVAIGLVAEVGWAVRHGHCTDPDLPARLARLLRRLGLPVDTGEWRMEALEAAMAFDKKTRDAMLVLPVPLCAGRMALVEVPVTELGDLISGSFDFPSR